MKIKICLLALLWFYSADAQDKQTVLLSGKLINFPSATTLEDFSELADLKLPDNDLKIIADSNDNFKITFRLKKANYFRLGRNVLYLTPGARLNVVVDFQTPEKATFKGVLSKENSYLKEVPFPLAGSYLDGGRNLKRTLQKTIDTVLILAQNSHNKLNHLHHVSVEFRSLETARINADVLNSFKMLGSIYIYNTHIPRDDIQRQKKVFKEADSLTKPIADTISPKLVNSAFLKIAAFRQIYTKIQKVPGANKLEMDKINDWDFAYSLSYEINSTADKQALIKLKPSLDSVANPAYRDALAKKIELKLQFGDGDIADDFAAVDTKNNSVKLSSLKGKLIVIDLWATWCIPCLNEMPYFEKLKTQFKDNPDVAFVALCVNDDLKKWQQNVLKQNRQGIQLFADRDQMIPYKIITIPRTIIIDKDFKIVKMVGPELSSPQMSDYIIALLKK